MTPSDRGMLLHRFGDVTAANAPHLAELEVRDNSKLMIEMLGQMKYLPRPPAPVRSTAEPARPADRRWELSCFARPR
jgi:hypothetical protein